MDGKADGLQLRGDALGGGDFGGVLGVHHQGDGAAGEPQLF